MEIYLRDKGFVGYGSLDWDQLPGHLRPPSPPGRGRRGRRPMPPGHIGQLLTIGSDSDSNQRSGESDAEYNARIDEIDEFCSNPREVVGVIQRFHNLTSINILAHSTAIDAAAAEAESCPDHRRGFVLGKKLCAGQIILFAAIRSNFSRWSVTDPGLAGLIHAGIQEDDAPDGIAAPSRRDPNFRGDLHLFQPRIVFHSCAIGQNIEFCQAMADTTETYVFASSVDQYGRQIPDPWGMHGPIRIFIPRNWSEWNVP